MDERLVLFTTPETTGQRRFFPIVRLSSLTRNESGWFSSEPVAMLIEENGEWYFSALEEGLSEDILLRAVPV